MADTFIAGGRGTMADSSNDNGGGHTGSVAWADVMGANGGPLHTVVEASYTHATGVITKVGEFAAGLTGTLVHVKNGSGAAWEDWYEITASDANTITIASGENGAADHADIDVWVGGAFKNDGTGIAKGLSLFAAASGDKVQIASNTTSPTTYPVAAEITMPSVAGTAAAPFRIYGVDYADGTELTSDSGRPIFQATAVITSIWSWVAAFDYCNVEMIVFDGNIDKATYCWHFGDANGSDYHVVKHCRFHHAISDGVYVQYTSDYFLCFGNEFDNNGGDGLRGNRQYFSIQHNKFHHNSGNGFEATTFYDASFCYNYVYSNGATGVDSSYATKNSSIINNIIYNNTGDGLGIRQNSGAGYSVTVVNNTIFSNGGYGINNNNIGSLHWPMDLMQLSNNHSWDNTSGHCREMDTPASDAEWADFMDGKVDGQRNITGDPEMVDPANADFDLEPASPLIRAGIDGTTIGATGRIAGNLVINRGMSGGMGG